jgi:transposase
MAGAAKATFSALLNPGTVGPLRCPTRDAPRLAWVDFLQAVDAWVGPEPEAVFAIVDNLSTHRAADVLLFSLAYPRWHFVFQPTYAAYLNLIEPWWKTLRRLALHGRRFETWAEMAQAVEEATAYWNAHRHPYRWGRRRRHRPRRQPGCARVPLPA